MKFSLLRCFIMITTVAIYLTCAKLSRDLLWWNNPDTTQNWSEWLVASVMPALLVLAITMVVGLVSCLLAFSAWVEKGIKRILNLPGDSGATPLTGPGVAGWPDGWPEFHNGCRDACDMLVGPCLCGASHYRGEFELVCGKVYRHMPGETLYAGRDISCPTHRQI